RRVSLGELEDHHVFPQRFLYNNGIKGTRANGILNRIPMSASTNKKIGSQAPNIYLRDESVVGNPNQEVLVKLCLNRALLEAEFSADNYQSFLSDRAHRVVALLKSVLPSMG